MLKKERLRYICEKVNNKGVITVNEIIQDLDVSDMTVRRDLDELEKASKLLRIHGGAQSLTYSLDYEMSHIEKSTVQVHEKQKIALYASTLIQEGETIYLGPGTTIQILATMLREKKVRVITNSYHVFEILMNAEQAEVILIGGEYRNHTGTFVGPITNNDLSLLKFSKAFISCNGIYNNAITTYSLEEGEVQKIALNNSRHKYLLADSKKFSREDFYTYYNLHDFDKVITDEDISPNVLQHYEQYTEIIIGH